MGKVHSILAVFLFLILSAGAAQARDLPVIRLGYIFTTDHAPLMAAMALGPETAFGGYSLEPLIAKEKYLLKKDGNPIARLDTLVAKSGSEVSTLFAQKHLDIGLSSITAVFTGIDKGVPMKIVCPVNLAGGGLVVPPDSPAHTWQDFIALAKAAEQPVKVGYHSPNSAPIIILEAALTSEGLTLSRNPNDTAADITLVDLKGTTNMLPALASRQVDAVVGPEPFPTTAAFKGTGRIVEELPNMPPAGKWSDYPCCVAAVSDAFIAEQPELVAEFARFIAAADTWCNENKEQSGIIGAAWIGLPEEVGKAQSQRFLSSFTDNWKDGADGYLEVLNKAGYFTGRLKDKTFEQAQEALVEYRFLQQ